MEMLGGFWVVSGTESASANSTIKMVCVFVPTFCDYKLRIELRIGPEDSGIDLKDWESD